MEVIVLSKTNNEMIMGDFFNAIMAKSQMTELIATNEYTKRYGLELTCEDAELIIQEKNNTLRTQQRVEFGKSIIPKIIYEFCDSDYISQDNYVETLQNLQDIFFLYKNEMQDEISDDELLHFMREQFDNVCFGSVEYLSETCLDIFAQAIRAGYRDYTVTDGYGEMEKIDIVTRWDRKLYEQALEDLNN